MIPRRIREKHDQYRPIRQPSGRLSFPALVPSYRGTLREQVALPSGESCARWVASHAVEFYYDVSTIWAVMGTDPSRQSLQPGEGFPPGVEYTWTEDKSGKTVSVSAPTYIDKVLSWIDQQLNDNNDTSPEFLQVLETRPFSVLCAEIFIKLWRIYGILYSTFYKTCEALDMAPHLNTCFKQFIFFSVEFNLLPEHEIVPLDALVKPVREQYYAQK